MDRKERRDLLEASALGFMFPVALGLGFLWGYGMDKLFGTWPWLTAIFTAFGAIAAFLNLFRLAGKDGS
jgi:F0F1-type ATP synthase assembly protein I